MLQHCLLVHHSTPGMRDKPFRICTCRGRYWMYHVWWVYIYVHCYTGQYWQFTLHTGKNYIRICLKQYSKPLSQTKIFQTV